MAQKTILLIEDNATDEQLTRRAFRKNNVMNEVVVACDGVDAVDYLNGTGAYEQRNTSEVPSLIVLDLNLPRMDGLDVLTHIRSVDTLRHVPVVVMTSAAGDEVVHQAYDRGANSFVRKPVDATEFSDVVTDIAVYWLLLNESGIASMAD